MSVVFAKAGGPNDIHSVDEVGGRTILELLTILNLPNSFLAIRTPLYSEVLKPVDVPTLLFPGLIVEEPDRFCFPEYYIRIVPLTDSTKISVNVKVTTQMENIQLPPMLVHFQIQRFDDLLVQDVMDLCQTTLGYETVEQTLLQSEQELDNSAPAPPILLRARENQLEFKCVLVEAACKKIRQRNAHAHEFIDTERQFCENLKSIINYLEPAIREKKLFEEKQLRTLFRDIPIILRSHSLLLELLEKEGASYSSRFAGIMLNTVDKFKVSAAFVSNFKANDELIKSKRENRSCDRAMSQIEDENPDGSGRPFMAYYITPVQRYPRYPLLLRDLDKVTPPWHPDKPFMQMAGSSCDRVNKEIDHVSYRVKQLITMEELQRELPETFPIHENQREIIIKTNVRFTKPKSTPGVLYLFNDIVLLTTKQKKTQTPVLTCPVSDFTFTKNRPTKNSITLDADNKEHVVMFDDDNERENWFDSFDHVRSDHFDQITYDDSFVKWRDTEVGENVNAVMNHDCCVVNGIAYFFGGMNVSLGSVSTMITYNYALDEWTTQQTPVPPRYLHSLVGSGGFLYIIFGKDKKKVLNDIWTYEVKSGQWNSINCKQEGRCGHSAVALGDNIVIFGGQDKNGKLLNDVLLLNPNTKNVSEIPPGAKVPAPRMLHSACRLSAKKMIIVGGKVDRKIDGEIYVFNLSKNSWKHKSKLSGKPRYYHRCLMSGRFMFIIGGADSKQGARTTIIDTTEWARVPVKEFGNVAIGLTRFAAGMVNQNVLVTYGGADPTEKIPFCSSWRMEIGTLKAQQHTRKKIKRKKEGTLSSHRTESQHTLVKLETPPQPEVSPISTPLSQLPLKPRHKSVTTSMIDQLNEFEPRKASQSDIRKRMSMGSAFNEDIFALEVGIDLSRLPNAMKLAAKMKMRTLFAVKKKNEDDENRIARMLSILNDGDPPEGTPFLMKVYDDHTNETRIVKVHNMMGAEEIETIVIRTLGRDAILSLLVRSGKNGDLNDENLHEAFSHVYRKEMPALLVSAI